MCSNMLSIVVPIHSLPSMLLQLMSSSPSPAELLYQCQLGTTIPAKFCNTDPAAFQFCEWIATHSNTFQSQADKQCKSLAPLYAGQLVAMCDTLHKIWVPTTVHSTPPIMKKKYAEILLCYRQLFIKDDVFIGEWGIFGAKVFLRYSQFFVKGDFIIGQS